MTEKLKDAYFAGLIDGEGTIGVYAFASGMIRPIIKVDMTCEKTVKALHEHFGGYFGVKKIEAKTNRKQQWHWEVTFLRAKAVCERIRPYLITKADNADAVLALPARKRGPRPKTTATDVLTD